MKNSELPSLLLLRVNNSDQLESGYDASRRFTPQGGRVGSDDTCFWRVQDNAHRVADVHFAIVWQDTTFCLQALSFPLMLNRAAVKDGIGLIRLQHGDEISLGILRIQVFISLDGGEIQDPLQVSPQSLVTPHHNLLEPMLEQQRNASVALPSEPTPLIHSRSLDPLQALQNEALLSPVDISMLTAQREHDALSHQHGGPEMTSREQVIEQEYMTLPEINHYLKRADSEMPQEDMSKNYVAITPLMRGLDAPLTLADSQQVHDFMEEAGRTLQAAIRGLLSLQRQQDTLSDKHLRPLEDNPLRLSLNYDTTLNVLFAEGKSPVHLSAPQAVAESLRNVQLHYQANQTAITEALAAMLLAFSPDRLVARFAQYRRSAERGETDSGWAWNMYCRYYEELTSSRQQGLNKLFHEVYEQAYDRALRRAEQERQE